MAAFSLQDGTICGFHKFLESFKKSLDDRDLMLSPFKCEHILAKSLPASVHPMEAVAGWTVRVLVDLVRPMLHVVERFLVRDITFRADVVCVFASVEHVPQDLELKRVHR